MFEDINMNLLKQEQIFFKNLSRIRKLVGLNQKEFGAKMNFSQGNYSEFESGATDPRLSSLIKASEAASTSLSELFRDSSLDSIRDQELLNRIHELEPKAKESLMTVIRSFLESQEEKKRQHPDFEKRMKELGNIRDSKK